MSAHDTPLDPALLRGLTCRRMDRRDIFKMAGLGAAAAALAACGVKGKATGTADAGARRGREVLGRQDRRHATSTSPTGRCTWTRSTRSSTKFTAQTGITRDLQGSHQRRPDVVREDPAAARGEPVDRLRPDGHHERRRVPGVRRAGLLRAAGPQQDAELHGQRGAEIQERGVRQGQRLQRAVGVRHHRHRLQPEVREDAADQHAGPASTSPTRARSACSPTPRRSATSPCSRSASSPETSTPADWTKAADWLKAAARLGRRPQVLRPGLHRGAEQRRRLAHDGLVR